LWPKKKAEVPKDNLGKLAKAFDTIEDPTLQLKGLSLKRGALVLRVLLHFLLPMVWTLTGRR
jgi:hypothetical protein